MRVFIKRLAFANKDQKGFTLIELLVAVAISSIITVGLVMTIFQLFGGHAQSSGEMTVIRQVQNAGYYISRDTQMAQEVSTVDDPGTPETELVTLTWYEYEGDPETPERYGDGHQVVYSLEGDELNREYYFKYLGTEDWEFQYTTFIAEYIDVEGTSCQLLGDKLVLKVTASIGGWKPQSETRVYEAKPRPNVY